MEKLFATSEINQIVICVATLEVASCKLNLNDPIVTFTRGTDVKKCLKFNGQSKLEESKDEQQVIELKLEEEK